MRAAEREFASRGVAAVSLREVAAAAGQRNVSAVMYHFGSKLELLECVLERHSDPMQKSFSAQLETWKNDTTVTLFDHVALLVNALAQKLDDTDGGKAYLLLCAQLAASPDYPLTERRAAQAEGANLLAAKMLTFVAPISPEIFPLRMMRFANVLYLSFADYIRLSNIGFVVPRENFLKDLTQALVNLVAQS